jgi:hypothetical protein
MKCSAIMAQACHPQNVWTSLCRTGVRTVAGPVDAWFGQNDDKTSNQPINDTHHVSLENGQTLARVAQAVPSQRARATLTDGAVDLSVANTKVN